MREEQKEALEAIKALAPEAVDKLKALMDSEDTPPSVMLRACALILDRTYGKAEASVKLAPVSQTVEKSQEYIRSLIDSIREMDQDESK